jgi:hypothetical protein
VGAGLGLGLGSALHGHSLVSTGPLVSAISVSVGAAAAIVFVSSLVDWLWILPRVEGLVGPTPWDSPADRRWRLVTQVWLLHRLATRLVVSAALVAVPISMAAATSGAMRSAWIGAVAIFAGAIVPINETLAFVASPSAWIGQVLERDDGPAYIIDVSLQGLGVRLLRCGLSPVPSPRRHDALVSFGELSRYSRRPPTEKEIDIDRRRVKLGQLSDAVPPGAAEGPPRFDSLVATEAAIRDEERSRSEDRSALELGLLVASSVAALAAAAARLATDAQSALAAGSVIAASALAAAGLVRAVLSIRLRQLIGRDQALVGPIDAELTELGLAVERQRSALRDEFVLSSSGAPAGDG